MAHNTKRRQSYELRIGERGRIVLPARVRQRLHLDAGDRLILTVDDTGEMRLATLERQIDKCRGIFAHISPGRIFSEELIAERRAEAKREERE